jgi:hypothetical protein
MKPLIKEGQHDLSHYAIERFVRAWNTHHINNETSREIENILNGLTNKIYDTNNQKLDLYFVTNKEG